MESVELCWRCKKEPIPDPEFCCSGRDCGCMGKPIDPPFCDKCLEELEQERVTGDINRKKYGYFI